MPELFFDIRFNANESDLKTVKDEANRIQKEVNQSLEGDTSKKTQATKATREQAKAEKELYNEFKRQVTVNEVKFRQGELSQKQALENAESIERQAIETGVLTDQTLRGARAQKTMFLSQQRIQTGFTGMAQTSARANQSLMNLGRIVQDLPFGFLGISNNIDPALNSFRSLKEETGSTGGALKALLGSLSGSGGLIFALGSLLPSAILIAQKGFNMYSKNAKESKDVTDRFSDSVKSFIDDSASLRDGEAFSFLGKASVKEEIESLERILRAGNKIIDAKKQALRAQDELIIANRNLRKVRDEDTSAQEQYDELKRLQEAAKGAADNFGFLLDKYDITIDEVEDFNEAIEKSNKELRILKALTELDPLASFREDLEQTTQGLLDKFNTGLLKSSEEFKRFQESTEDVKLPVDLLAKQAGEIQQTIMDLQRGDADVLKALGIDEEDTMQAIKILQDQLSDLSDFVPEKPTVPIQIPKDEIIDNFADLNMLLSDVGIEPIEMPPLDFSVYEESEKQLKESQKQLDDDLLAEKLLNLEIYQQAYEKRAKMQQQVDRSLAQSRIQLERNVMSALTSLSQAFSKDNKALAIGILAIEKGLAIAQVIVEGIKQFQKAQAAASAWSALGIIPAAINAQAQAKKIIALTAVNAAAIAAQGIGEAVSISKRGSRSVGAGGTSFGGGEQRGFFTDEPQQREPIRPAMSQQTQLQVSFEDGVDEVIAIKAKNGAKKIKKGTIFVTE